MPVVIRPERAGDEAAIGRVHERAFGRPAEAGFVEAIRDTEAFVPELSLVAYDEDDIVGHVLLSAVPLDSGVEVLALAPLAVLLERQRQGIGALLVTAALERARRTGYPLVVVVGDPAYYRRFGFARASDLGIEAPFPVPEDAWMALALPGHRPAARARVVYPPAFAGV
ncbi:MAG: N-acetyltransferase [Gaiellales bacterium]